MSVLLDTHALLWALEDNPRLGTRARSVLNDPMEVKFLSIASAWEMAIKQSLGKLKLAMPVERVIAERVLPLGVQLLGVQPSHVGLFPLPVLRGRVREGGSSPGPWRNAPTPALPRGTGRGRTSRAHMRLS